MTATGGQDCKASGHQKVWREWRGVTRDSNDTCLSTTPTGFSYAIAKGRM
jgi:hypothetical protein